MLVLRLEEPLSDPTGPEYDEGAERRHGLWGLAVLVMIAIIVVGFIILFTGSNEGGSGDKVGQDDSTLSGALGGSSTNSSSTQRRTTSTSDTPSSPSALPNRPCEGDGPCPVNADVVGVAAGINELRNRQGLKTVPAAASRAAQDCAVAHGTGPSCVPHYMYAQVDSTDATGAVKALQNVNESWLLDPTITRIEIGWAREPGGRYDCVVLKFP